MRVLEEAVKRWCPAAGHRPAARRYTPPEDQGGATSIEDEEQLVVLDEDEEEEDEDGGHPDGDFDDNDFVDIREHGEDEEDEPVILERVGVMSSLNSAGQVQPPVASHPTLNSSEEESEFDVEFDEAWEDEEEVDDLRPSNGGSSSRSS
eukprot:gene3859-4116_t